MIYHKEEKNGLILYCMQLLDRIREAIKEANGKHAELGLKGLGLKIEDISHKHPVALSAQAYFPKSAESTDEFEVHCIYTRQTTGVRLEVHVFIGRNNLLDAQEYYSWRIPYRDPEHHETL